MILSLNQKYFLVNTIVKDEILQKVFNLPSYDGIADKLKNITYSEYKYILALFFNKKRGDLNKKLIQLGFEPLIGEKESKAREEHFTQQEEINNYLFN